MSRRLSTSSLTHDAITNKVVGNSNSLIYLPGFLLILIVNKIVGWFPIFEALNEQFVLYSVLSSLRANGFKRYHAKLNLAPRYLVKVILQTY